MKARIGYLAGVRAFPRGRIPFHRRMFGYGRPIHGARSGAGWSVLRLQWRRLAKPFTPVHQYAPIRATAFHSWLTHVHMHLTDPQASPRTLASRGQTPVRSGHAAWVVSPASPSTRFSSVLGARHQPAPLALPKARAVAQPAAQAWRPRAVVLAASATPPALAFTQRATRLSAPGNRALSTTAAAVPLRPPAAPAVGVPPSGLPAAGKNNPLMFGAAKSARGAIARPGGVAPVSGAAMLQRQTPQLVWPARIGTQADQTRDSDRTYGHGVAPVEPGAPRQALSTARAEPVAPPAAGIAAQLRDGRLDAALADRLTTEVIRRVERSMRIERERRGY